MSTTRYQIVARLKGDVLFYINAKSEAAARKLLKNDVEITVTIKGASDVDTSEVAFDLVNASIMEDESPAEEAANK